MKVTLDLEQLLNDGKITQIEYEKLSDLAAKSTGTLAFNILIGFGIIAVSGAAFAFVPAPITAIVLGIFIVIAGLALLQNGLKQWKVLSNTLILFGSMMISSGILIELNGSLVSILSVTAIFAVASIFARSTFLAVLATLMLSASIGAITGFYNASYFLVVQEPTIIVILFSVLAIGLYQLSKKLSDEYARIAIASARACVFLVNFGFWVGSLWGERSDIINVTISDNFFAILWALTLLASAIWSWKRKRRWVFNTVATFGGILFYTQWFDHLGVSPGTLFTAGLLALGFAVGLWSVNLKMKEHDVPTFDKGAQVSE